MRRTIVFLACVAAAALTVGCGAAKDGTDIAGNSARAATDSATPAAPAPKPA